jgi:hypothetical protein
VGFRDFRSTQQPGHSAPPVKERRTAGGSMRFSYRLYYRPEGSFEVISKPGNAGKRVAAVKNSSLRRRRLALYLFQSVRIIIMLRPVAPYFIKYGFFADTCGGEGGIRTHGKVTPTHAFQACSFNRSDTSPLQKPVDCMTGTADPQVLKMPNEKFTVFSFQFPVKRLRNRQLRTLNRELRTQSFLLAGGLGCCLGRTVSGEPRRFICR